MRVTAPRSGAIAVVLAVLALSAAACGGGTPSSGATGASGSPRQVLAAATPTTTTTTTPPIGKHDGSLGDADTKQACSLLTAPEIEAQFGGPVGEATPIYPYCQWLVGTDAFVAVTIYRQPISEARNFHPVRFDTSGLGDDGGYIATTRAVFFGKGDVTYSILWQKVGDFTTVETEKLTALAQAVLGRV
jgi:hypothetical protein